ncbi:Sir2 family NAD-dependent protein deacetylase, partial [Staphylococcus pasteuri]|uniref:Sir2 family NAD-dependent protein deacetylase n=1 Tax=Staphylococcus pasteuri TaxID=45972 RepID=UPI0036F4364A
MQSLKQLIHNSQKILFFTPPPVSLPTPLPHFTSIPPLFHQISKHPYSPQYLLTHDYFQHHPHPFINFSHKTLIYPHKLPNTLHQSIPHLEHDAQCLRLITQNIHRFHSDAGTNH